jgi:hypothetical protein
MKYTSTLSDNVRRLRLTVNDVSNVSHNHTFHPQPQYPRRYSNREQFIHENFLLVDTANKGYVDAQDLVRLAKEVGDDATDTNLSIPHAEAILAAASSNGSERLNAQDFYALFSPPDP